jgi:Domain of unknown function (DUF4282)
VRTRGHPPFFKTLFDLSFTRFLTPRLIPLAYVLGLIVVLAYALAMATAVGASTSSGGQGISWFASVIVFLFVFVLGAIFVRIQIEVTAVAFRIYERVVPPAEGPVD